MKKTINLPLLHSCSASCFSTISCTYFHCTESSVNYWQTLVDSIKVTSCAGLTDAFACLIGASLPPYPPHEGSAYVLYYDLQSPTL
jgi:hypothetical protein